ncbi:MAG: hypothetical protein NUV70_00395 [Caldiserica bacterium]|nr:hypothetical protein [Caldisericota bacterium]
MQQVINIISTVVLALIILFLALGAALPSWLGWILFIVALVGVILSIFSKKQ